MAPLEPEGSPAHTLTPRQVQVLDLLRRGHRTREIARTLGISERAVTAHNTRLMAAFGVSNRTSLIAALMTGSDQVPAVRTDARELARYEDAPFLVAVTIGPRHVFRSVNRMWEQVMHLRRASVLGKTVAEVFPDAPPASYAARQLAFKEGRPTTGNTWRFTWTSGDGKERETALRYIYQPLRSTTGKVEGLLLIASQEPKKTGREPGARPPSRARTPAAPS